MRSLGLAVVFLALLIGAGVGLGFTNLDLDGLLRSLDEDPQISEGAAEPGKRSGETRAKKAASDKTSRTLSKLADELGGEPPGGAEKAAFDIARVSPDGVSVFAGRAKPFENVNVLVGQQVVGTASADGQGNWTLVTEEKIPDISAELKLQTGAAAQPKKVASSAQQNQATIPAASGTPENVAEVNKRLFASLRGLVDEAREKNQNGDAAPGTESMTATRELQQFAAVEPNSSDANTTSVQARSIPIPVQFVYREAEFTEQGREAVQLLLEYLNVSRFDRVTLSGHADERGSSELNLQLSRDRLNAVRDRLRAGGFGGKLVLLPKGETEPFIGVDRNTLSAQDLYQLDRRVELRLER